MTSLLDRPITAASDDGVCRWHAAKLWQTRCKISKLLKLNLICVISSLQAKNLLKCGRLIFFQILNLKQRIQLDKGQLGSYWLELAIRTSVPFIALPALSWMEIQLKFKNRGKPGSKAPLVTLTAALGTA